MNDGIVNTLLIQSTLYGEIEVLPEQVYHFSSGIVGLEQLRKFALLPYEESELYTLQAFDDEIGLMLVPASLTDQHLEFEVDQETVARLEIQSPEDVVVFYILRLIEGVPYINQKAPLLLSPNTKKGCQYIVQNDAISVRVPLVLKGE